MGSVGTELCGVVDAIVFSLNSQETLKQNNEIGIFARDKPPDAKLRNQLKLYAVVELSDRKHSTTLRQVTPLSRCTFSVKVYGLASGVCSQFEYYLKQTCTNLRHVPFNRFEVLNARVDTTSEAKEEDNVQDKRFIYTKTITLWGDIVEEENIPVLKIPDGPLQPLVPSGVLIFTYYKVTFIFDEPITVTGIPLWQDANQNTPTGINVDTNNVMFTLDYTPNLIAYPIYVPEGDTSVVNSVGQTVQSDAYTGHLLG